MRLAVGLLFGLCLCFVNETLEAFNFWSPPWFCRYPCECAVRELNCLPDVSMVKDGCDCCYMCARQHGDLCNVKDRCDSNHDLYCDMSKKPHGPGTGICRAKSKKPCKIGNQTFADGKKFKHPDECSQMCTCQNGKYGCYDQCPDQYRKPSEVHCWRPRLMQVSGQCCKQWTCDNIEQIRIPVSSSGKQPRHLSAPMRSSNYMMNQKSYQSAYQNTQPDCKPSESKWGRCSATCNIGISTRTVTYANCTDGQELRLCYIRPCDVSIGPTNGKRCTPTVRLPTKQRVRYEDCKSVHQMNFKVCTNCKSTRCCYPRREKTRHVDFECGDGRRKLFAFMWIKSCRCDRKCYEKDPDDKGMGIY